LANWFRRRPRVGERTESDEPPLISSRHYQCICRVLAAARTNAFDAVRYGLLPCRFRACGHGWQIGREETGADRTPSTPRLLRMSPVPNTPTVLTTRPWCSTPSRAEATSGLAASRYRHGWWGPLAAASTQRVRCGRSFVSIGFRGSSEPWGPDSQ
jgi:hypothetical protein